MHSAGIKQAVNTFGHRFETKCMEINMSTEEYNLFTTVELVSVAVNLKSLVV